MARVLEGVKGRLHPAEAAVLYRQARTAAEQSGRVCLVEIGSWQGRSTLALSIGLRDGGGRGRVFAMDPHADAGEGEHNLQVLRRNIERGGVSDLVEIVRTPSTSAVERFADGSVDLLFVDGDHSFEAVCLDILQWTPKLRPGAVLGFNDPFLPGVRRAVRHLLLSGASPYRHPRWMVNTIYFDYLPGEPYHGQDRLDRRRAQTLLRLLGPYLGAYNNVVPGQDRDRRAGRVAAALNRSLVYPVARQLLPQAR
jgi:predicted O-methyltransferase YrrM